MATIDLLKEETIKLSAQPLCFVLGCVEEQRAKYLYIQGSPQRGAGVFKPFGAFYPPNARRRRCWSTEHEGSEARLLGITSIPAVAAAFVPAKRKAASATRCWSRWKRCRQSCKR